VADAYANRVLAEARGEAAQLLEEAEGYRARVVNEAEGEASRFTAVLGEYQKAPEVTRKRLYLETMEQVLGDSTRSSSTIPARAVAPDRVSCRICRSTSCAAAPWREQLMRRFNFHHSGNRRSGPDPAVVDLHRRRTRKGAGSAIRPGRQRQGRAGPGLQDPLIQEVARYDDRILSRDIEPLEVTPLDDRRLVVDAFARYRIADVNQFRQAVSGDRPARSADAGSIRSCGPRPVRCWVRSPPNDILSSDRAALMSRIRAGAFGDAQELGLEIIDVRLKPPTFRAEPGCHLRPDAGRTRARSDRRARPRQRGGAAGAGAGRPDRGRACLGSAAGGRDHSR
jgi:regulator of protease activity HflC (stomatin/prohibitin superfamily)